MNFKHRSTNSLLKEFDIIRNNKLFYENTILKIKEKKIAQELELRLEKIKQLGAKNK